VFDTGTDRVDDSRGFMAEYDRQAARKRSVDNAQVRVAQATVFDGDSHLTNVRRTDLDVVDHHQPFIRGFEERGAHGLSSGELRHVFS
jgi:hypothetical protein